MCEPLTPLLYIYLTVAYIDKDCLNIESCQDRGFEIEASYDIWIYNLCRKAILEIIWPVQSVPTDAKDNMKAVLASIRAWVNGAKQTAGQRNFPRFVLYTSAGLSEYNLPMACKPPLCSA
jgi:hypothetical protein